MSDLAKKNIVLSQYSTTILNIDTTPSNWDTVITTPDNLVIDVNYAGVALIVNNDIPFSVNQNSVSWAATTGLIPPNPDGNNIVLIDNTGTVQIIASTNPDLPISGGTYNQNNSVQIGLAQTSAGLITRVNILITYRGNNMLRFANLLSKFLGVINSSANPVFVTRVGGNLQLQYSDGQVISSDVGSRVNQDFQNPDTVDVPASNPALIVLTDRNSVIQGAGTDVDNTLYESSPGVFSVMPNNTHKLIFFRIVPSSKFLGCVLGQSTYGTAQAAIDSGEPPDYSENLSRSANTVTLTVAKNEADLNNGEIRTQPRIS